MVLQPRVIKLTGADDLFGAGRLNQAEFTARIEPILSSPDGYREHLHNQLIAAIYGNVTREMPDQGLAPWVSANDKPSTTAGSKPVSGDAAERRLKGEVMLLPARDRRRLKDIVLNDVSRHEHRVVCVAAKKACAMLTTAARSLTRTSRWPVYLRTMPGRGPPGRTRCRPVRAAGSAG